MLSAPAALALLAGCAQEQPDEPGANGDTADPGSGGGSGDGTVLMAGDVERMTPPGDAPVGSAVEGMTGFGFDLLEWVDADLSGDNIVLSPLSIAYAFSMVRVGARGVTADEIDRTFGLPDGYEAAFNVLSGRLATTDGPPPERGSGDEPDPPVVAIANGLFLQEGFEVEEEFLRTLAAQYGAGVQSVDFMAGDAKDIIDAWVQEQTADRIEQLFDELPSTVRLVLANAIYLKASWAVPFAESATADEPFIRADGGDVQVPMMHTTPGGERVGYGTGEGWEVVELDYTGGELAMWVLVPAQGRMPLELLRPDVLVAAGAALTPTRVDLAMPRWDFATDVELRVPLLELGMPTAFSAGADFSGIAPDLMIDDAIHRANITVDEQGTEAAAVTGISMQESAAPQPEIQLTVDRPFAFAIMHKETGTPLFIGQVTDPT